MPHPRRVDDLAEVLARVGDRVDEYVLEHIATGARLPTDGRVLEVMAPDVEAALVAAFDDISTDWTPEELVSAREAILGELAVVVRRALRDAAARRIDAQSVPQDRLQSDDSVVGWVRAGLGLGALIAAVTRKEGRIPDVGQVRYLAAVSGQPAPRRVGPVVRQIVRTRIAEERNTVAANVADRAGLVIRVEDARKGPTDEPCEDVNGRYATTLWLRRHRVEHPNCVAEGQVVSGSATVTAAWSRSFHGEMITIVTASGAEITVTPNHPVLTGNGFQPAKVIKPGTEIVRYVGCESLGVRVPNDVDGPPLIEQVSESLIEAGGVSTGVMPAATEQFYGDGTADGEVNVVWADSFLMDDVPELVQVAAESRFVGGDLASLLVRDSPSVQVGVGALHPTNGVVGCGGQSRSSGRTDSLHVKTFGVRPVAADSPAPESGPDRRTGASDVGGDHVGRFPAYISTGDLCVDRVVGVVVARGEGRVHDLSTSEGWFACNTIIVANCTRRGRPAKLPAGQLVTLLE